MNWSKLIWAAIVAFIALIITDVIIHLILLQGTYQDLGNFGIFQTWDVIMSYWWVLLITSAVYSFFFAFIFAKGYEGKGIAEIIRYAIYVTLFFCFVTCFNQFVFYGVPYGIVWLWIVIGFIQNLIMAIFVGLIYRPKGTVAQQAV
jgi:hypothetical protein